MVFPSKSSCVSKFIVGFPWISIDFYVLLKALSQKMAPQGIFLRCRPKSSPTNWCKSCPSCSWRPVEAELGLWFGSKLVLTPLGLPSLNHPSSNGKKLQMEGCNGKNIYKWWMFHGYLKLPEGITLFGRLLTMQFWGSRFWTNPNLATMLVEARKNSNLHYRRCISCYPWAPYTVVKLSPVGSRSNEHQIIENIWQNECSSQKHMENHRF